MKLLTRDIQELLQGQYRIGKDLKDLYAFARLFHPRSNVSWYVIRQNPEDPTDLWGIMVGNEIEVGSFYSVEIEGLPLEIDQNFKPENAQFLLYTLLKGGRL